MDPLSLAAVAVVLVQQARLDARLRSLERHLEMLEAENAELRIQLMRRGEMPRERRATA